PSALRPPPLEPPPPSLLQRPAWGRAGLPPHAHDGTPTHDDFHRRADRPRRPTRRPAAHPAVRLPPGPGLRRDRLPRRGPRGGRRDAPPGRLRPREVGTRPLGEGPDAGRLLRPAPAAVGEEAGPPAARRRRAAGARPW